MVGATVQNMSADIVNIDIALIGLLSRACLTFEYGVGYAAMPPVFLIHNLKFIAL